MLRLTCPQRVAPRATLGSASTDTPRLSDPRGIALSCSSVTDTRTPPRPRGISMKRGFVLAAIFSRKPNSVTHRLFLITRAFCRRVIRFPGLRFTASS